MDWQTKAVTNCIEVIAFDVNPVLREEALETRLRWQLRLLWSSCDCIDRTWFFILRSPF